MTTLCRHCQKEFPTTASKQRNGKDKYCSKLCLHLANSTEIACLQCGQRARIPNCRAERGQRFCSPTCGNEGKRRPALERFWGNVAKSDGCWFWGGVDTGHHGSFQLDRATGARIGAHVFSFTLANGPVPRGMYVRHKCDKPSCVRPDHLELGTPKHNTQDAVQRGRIAYGSRQGSAKLTEKEVIEIRRKYAKGGVKQRDLGRAYNVSQGTIWQIVTGNYWRRAGGPRSIPRRN